MGYILSFIRVIIIIIIIMIMIIIICEIFLKWLSFFNIFLYYKLHVAVAEPEQFKRVDGGEKLVVHMLGVEKEVEMKEAFLVRVGMQAGRQTDTHKGTDRLGSPTDRQLLGWQTDR